MCNSYGWNWTYIVLSSFATLIIGLISVIIGATENWREQDGLEDNYISEFYKIYAEPMSRLIGIGVYYILSAWLILSMSFCYCTCSDQSDYLAKYILKGYIMSPFGIIFTGVIILAVHGGLWENSKRQYDETLQELSTEFRTTAVTIQENLKCCISGVLNRTNSINNELYKSCINVHGIQAEDKFNTTMEIRNCVDVFMNRFLYFYSYVWILAVIYLAINGIGTMFAALLLKHYNHQSTLQKVPKRNNFRSTNGTPCNQTIGLIIRTENGQSDAVSNC